jgi:hypothetical protein
VYGFAVVPILDEALSVLFTGEMEPSVYLPDVGGTLLALTGYQKGATRTSIQMVVSVTVSS